jgi:hypothetical protein
MMISFCFEVFILWHCVNFWNKDQGYGSFWGKKGTGQSTAFETQLARAQANGTTSEALSKKARAKGNTVEKWCAQG